MSKKLKFPNKGEVRNSGGKRAKQLGKARQKNWTLLAAFGEVEKKQGGWKKNSPKWSDLDED